SVTGDERRATSGAGSLVTRRSSLVTPSLHGVRAAAPAGALGLRVGDGEPALVEPVVEVDDGPAQVEHRPLVHHHLDAVELELVVGLLVVLRVEVELVLEPAAPAALHPHPQVQLAARLDR